MAVPKPLPRKKSRGSAFVNDSTDQRSSLLASSSTHNLANQLVHTVEVHATGGNGSASSENSLVVDKKKKKLRRKNTFSISKKNINKSEESFQNVGDIEIQNFNQNEGSIQKNGNETFSEGSSSPSSNKIKLIPILDSKKKKKPSGYATETLSEESNLDSPLMKPLVLPRSKIPIKTSEINSSANSVLSWHSNNDNGNFESNADEDDKEMKINDSTSTYPSPMPMPFPRKSVTKSAGNILMIESNKSIHGSPQSYCTSSSLDYMDTGSISKQRPKKHRKKKKLKDSNSEVFLQDPQKDKKSMNDITSTLSENKEISRSPKKSDFICITIHKCEPLQIRDFSTKPYVKVMLLDTESGKQKVNSKGEAIEPVVTKPYNYTFQRSSIPYWNEDLIVMEPLDTVKNPNTILLFSILDEEKSKIIAWGFLKPTAANGATNIGKFLRLQLFKPGKSSKNHSLYEVFNWWKSSSHKNYKSTLFVAVNGIPEHMVVKNNVGDADKNAIVQSSPEKSVTNVMSKKEDKDLEDVRWGRLPNLSCKLPNKYLARLPAGPDGSLAIAYSHSGLFLASANKVSLCVYTFRGRLYLSFRGHHGLVYSLKWSSNDKYLLSASADFSACVWDISNKIVSPIQTVSHPSYVYSCAWLDSNTFATGCFDNDIRLWKIDSAQLYQQASHHKGKINALLFYDNFLLSGDSAGEICIWNWNPGENLEFVRSLVIREIRGKVINKLSLHPGKKRLLVHTRDSVLRMVDISTGSVLHWFQGLVNNKLREDSTFCGCGSLVLAWSEDSTLCVWDSNTGAQAAIYPGLIPDSQPGVVDFHPRDHMMAVSAHSSQTPLLSILIYDRLSNGRDVGLVPLSGGRSISTISLNSDRSSGHSSDRSSESTPKKKEGLLKTLLGSKKKLKNETSNPLFMEEAVTDDSKISNSLSKKLDLTDSAPKESRLGDIIKRMDRILTSVSNSSSLYTS